MAFALRRRGVAADGGESAACLVVLLSPAAEETPQVAEAVDRAEAGRQPILPVRIAGTGGGALHGRLAALQPVDGIGRSAAAIARTVRRSLETGWSVFPPVARAFRPLGLSPASLAGIVAAIVVAVVLVLRPFDPRLLRPSDLRADDFRPQVTAFETEGARGVWRVDLGPSARVRESGLLDRIEIIELSTDGANYVARRYFPAPVEGAAGATALHLRIPAGDGDGAGPFRYPLDFIAEARGRMKARIEEGGWTRCSRATCFLRFSRNAGAMAELRWGFDDGPLDKSARVAVPVERFDDFAWIDANPRVPHQIMVPRGVAAMRFQVVYVDGTEGTVHRVAVQERP